MPTGSRAAAPRPGGTLLRFAGGNGCADDGPAGSQLLGARYYDPTLGRFLSPDPIGHAGGLNLYGYCGNDPVNTVDPSGLAPWYEDVAAGLLNAGPTASKWAWKQWMKLWPVKLQPRTSRFGNANPQSAAGMALRMRGGEVADGLDDMGGIVVSGVATGAMMAVAAGRAGCSGGGSGSGGGGGGGGPRGAYIVTPNGAAIPPGIQGTSPVVGRWAGIRNGRIGEALSRVPADWVPADSKTGQGVIFRNPANPLYDWVRIMPGNGSPYLRIFRNGSYVDEFGNVVPRKAGPGHIPLAP